jgi:hypothetical protein
MSETDATPTGQSDRQRHDGDGWKLGSRQRVRIRMAADAIMLMRSPMLVGTVSP